MKPLIKLFRFLRDYRASLIISLTLLVISTGLGLIQPRLIEYAIDGGIKAHNLSVVVWGAVGILVSALLSAALNLAAGFALIKASQGFGYQLRNALYQKIMSFSFANLDKWRTGELMVRLNSDVNTVRQFIRMGSFMIVSSILMIVGTLIAMFLTDIWLATIMAFIMPVIMVIFFLVATSIRPLFMKARKAVDALNNAMQENLAGAKLVRAFARQGEEIRKFEMKNQDNYDVSIEVGLKMSIYFPLFFLIGNLAVLAALWAGGWSLLGGGGGGSGTIAGTGLTLGKLVAFNNYASMAMFPILMLGMVLNFISMALASATRINEVMDEPATIVDQPGALVLPRLTGAIEFRNVRFRYGSAEPALDRINLKIQAGEKIGIIGTTGAGKTSLVNLVGRFYDPTEGQVLLDGIDVRQISLTTLRQRVAMVLQETVLFSGTIRDNVAFGAPDASQSDLDRVAGIADASQFIAEKAAGWDEAVGERGAGLSGGQRQRVAIARALAINPDILILDDVTSSLDATTERRITGELYREFRGRTAIIISQKINTIRNANRIVVMEDGQIIGMGSHEELLAGNPIYRTICETQLGITVSGGQS